VTMVCGSRRRGSSQQGNQWVSDAVDRSSLFMKNMEIVWLPGLIDSEEVLIPISIALQCGN